MKRVFVIDERDNVGTVVVEPVNAGEEVVTNGRLNDLVVVASNPIPYGHKIALKDIARGETVYKYGLSIGTATADIRTGDHVHIHNVESNRGRGDKFQGNVHAE